MRRSGLMSGSNSIRKPSASTTPKRVTTVPIALNSAGRNVSSNAKRQVESRPLSKASRPTAQTHGPAARSRCADPAPRRATRSCENCYPTAGCKLTPSIASHSGRRKRLRRNAAAVSDGPAAVNWPKPERIRSRCSSPSRLHGSHAITAGHFHSSPSQLALDSPAPLRRQPRNHRTVTLPPTIRRLFQNTQRYTSSVTTSPISGICNEQR